jgi:hypothetical protein
MKYVTRKKDPLIQIVRIYQTHHRLSSVTDRNLTRELQRGTRQLKAIIAEKTKERWQGKRIHENLMDIERSNRWLKLGDIEGDTESTRVAAQDQAFITNYITL